MEQRPKLYAIINPNSGTHSKDEIPVAIYNNIDSSKWEVTCYTLTPDDDLKAKVSQAVAMGYKGVVAIGGDGTVNSVAAALRQTGVPMGIVPCGSGNGLARHLQIPLNVEQALQIVNNSHWEDFDYCTVNDTPFFCTCGMGFDAQVAERFAQEGRRGPLTYVKVAFREYVKFHHETYHMEIDGKTMFERAFVITCANASQYGNNAVIAPKASMRDGLLDVVVIHPFLPLEAPFVGLRLFTRDIDQDINISTYKTPRLRIVRESPGPMHLDGEPMYMPAQLDIECHHGGIRIFCDPDPKKQL